MRLRVRSIVRFRAGQSFARRLAHRDGFAIGWQIYDPETGTFIQEGEWTQLKEDLASGQIADVQLTIQLPPERGHYHVYVSPVTPKDGWFYARNEPFVLVDAFVEHGKRRSVEVGQTTLEIASPPQAVEQHPQGVHAPVYVDLANRSLIRSMSRRESWPAIVAASATSCGPS